MTTDQPAPSSTETATDPSADPGGPERPPDWWHRDHPTFTALSGFFTGLVFVIVVPGLFAAILTWSFDDHTAEGLFPLVLVVLAVPAGLMSAGRTRRFGSYMLVGMLLTALVVGGVTAVVLWFLIRSQA